MAQDHYKELGVDRKASAAEIKKAYRKLARQYHPDRNPGDAKAEARFKQISQAHDTLGDPEKRKEYDRALANPFSNVGRGGGGGQPGFDASGFGDILSDLFGQATRGRTGGGTTRPRAERGRDLEAEISISFNDAIHGAEPGVVLDVVQKGYRMNDTVIRPARVVVSA